MKYLDSPALILRHTAGSTPRVRDSIDRDAKLLEQVRALVFRKRTIRVNPLGRAA